MATDVFQQSRRKLTMYYSFIMAAFLIVLIIVVHQSMEWSIDRKSVV